MSTFWRRWMTLWFWAVGAFGAVLAGAAFEATSGPTRLVFTVLHGPGELELDPHMRFAVALMGAVTLGWSHTLAAAIRAADLLSERGRPVWRWLIASVLVWYSVDGALSVATGFALNILPNTVFLAAFLVPLIGGRVLQGQVKPA